MQKGSRYLLGGVVLSFLTAVGTSFLAAYLMPGNALLGIAISVLVVIVTLVSYLTIITKLGH